MNQDGVNATRWAQSTGHWSMCSSNMAVMFPSRLHPQIAKTLPSFSHSYLTLRTLAFLSSSPILDHAGRLPTITSGFPPYPIPLSLFHLQSTSLAFLFQEKLPTQSLAIYAVFKESCVAGARGRTRPTRGCGARQSWPRAQCSHSSEASTVCFRKHAQTFTLFAV